MFVAEFEVERIDGIIEMTHLGRADDGSGDDGFRQQPRECNLNIARPISFSDFG